MEKNINLNFYGVRVSIRTEWSEVAERLEKDFSYFLTTSTSNSSLGKEVNLEVLIERGNDLALGIREKEFSHKTKKVSFFDQGKVRYCLYPSGGAVKFNFFENSAFIQGEELHSIHEIAYLLILSRVGKALDLKGLHRIHGAAFTYKRKLCLLAFSSGTGKSTLIDQILSQKDISLYSDDSPLVDSSGKLYPFPLRLGFEAGSALPKGIDVEGSYELNRYHFGKKALIPIENISAPIGAPYDEMYAFTGIRGSEFNWQIDPGFQLWKQLFREAFIGYGLPILFEYFWEPGVKDFLTKSRIALMRIIALVSFVKKTKKYRLTLKETNGKPDYNANLLIENLEDS